MPRQTDYQFTTFLPHDVFFNPMQLENDFSSFNRFIEKYSNLEYKVSNHISNFGFRNRFNRNKIIRDRRKYSFSRTDLKNIWNFIRYLSLQCSDGRIYDNISARFPVQYSHKCSFNILENLSLTIFNSNDKIIIHKQLKKIKLFIETFFAIQTIHSTSNDVLHAVTFSSPIIKIKYQNPFFHIKIYNLNTESFLLDQFQNFGNSFRIIESPSQPIEVTFQRQISRDSLEENYRNFRSQSLNSNGTPFDLNSSRVLPRNIRLESSFNSINSYIFNAYNTRQTETRPIISSGDSIILANLFRIANSEAVSNINYQNHMISEVYPLPNNSFELRFHKIDVFVTKDNTKKLFNLIFDDYHEYVANLHIRLRHINNILAIFGAQIKTFLNEDLKRVFRLLNFPKFYSSYFIGVHPLDFDYSNQITNNNISTPSWFRNPFEQFSDNIRSFLIQTSEQPYA